MTKNNIDINKRKIYKIRFGTSIPWCDPINNQEDCSCSTMHMDGLALDKNFEFQFIPEDAESDDDNECLICHLEIDI